MTPSEEPVFDPVDRSMAPVRWGCGAAILCLFLLVLTVYSEIPRSRSSTAAFDYISAPVAAFAIAVPVFFAGWCLGYFFAGWQAKARDARIRAYVAGCVPLTLLLWGAQAIWGGFATADRVHEIEKMDSRSLARILQDQKLARNKYILGAIAQNPNASAEILHQIVAKNDPALNRRMGSPFDVLGKNTRAWAVMRLVARHPNTAPADLEVLSRNPETLVSADAAASPRLPVTAMRRLAERPDDWTASGLAQNPLTPPDVLAALAVSSNQYTRGDVARHPSVNKDTLQLLSWDVETHVRWNVIANPHTPRGVLERMVHDADPAVQRKARCRVAQFEGSRVRC